MPDDETPILSMMFLDLPCDLIEHVLQFTSVKLSCRIATVARRLLTTVENMMEWKTFYTSRWDPAGAPSRDAFLRWLPEASHAAGGGIISDLSSGKGGKHGLELGGTTWRLLYRTRVLMGLATQHTLDSLARQHVQRKVLEAVHFVEVLDVADRYEEALAVVLVDALGRSNGDVGTESQKSESQELPPQQSRYPCNEHSSNPVNQCSDQSSFHFLAHLQELSNCGPPFSRSGAAAVNVTRSYYARHAGNSSRVRTA